MDIDEFLDIESAKTGTTGILPVKKESGAKKGSQVSIQDQIGLLRNALEKNDLKKAGDLYLEIKERFTNLAKQQIEEKRFLHDELDDMNNALSSKMESMLQDTAKRIKEIEVLIAKGNAYLSEGKLATAEQIMRQAKELFDRIPDAFSEKKMQLDGVIMNYSAKVAIEKSRSLMYDFAAKKAEIGRLITEGFGALKAGSTAVAKSIYHKINSVWATLPDGFVYEKLMLYKNILRLYKESELGIEVIAMGQQPYPAGKGSAASPLTTPKTGASMPLSTTNKGN